MVDPFHEQRPSVGAPLKCPICHLTNPSTAQVCDCGYNFETHNKGNPIPGSISSRGRYRSLDGNEYELASLGERLGGQFLDALTGASPILIGSLISQKIGTVVSGGGITVGAVAFWGGMAVFVLYLLFQDGLPGGQSVGKRIVRTAVIYVATGRPCSLLGSAARNIIQVLGVFDWIFILGGKRQRLGDMLVGTVVIRKRS
jgi:uncharacterized RDD family membrane protein YckC